MVIILLLKLSFSWNTFLNILFFFFFFAKEQSPSPPPQKDKTLVTEQVFVEGDFPLACFPDILPPGLSGAQGSASAITLPQPRGSVGYESGGGPLRGRGEQRPRQRGLAVAWNFMETGGRNPFAQEIRFLIPRVGRNRLPTGMFPQELLRRGEGQSFPPALVVQRAQWFLSNCVMNQQMCEWTLRWMLAFVFFSYWLQNVLGSQCPCL